MANEFLEKFGNFDYDYMVSVPIHRSRMSKRQFNQSELLALELANYIPVPVNFSLLTQTKATCEQVHIGKGKRWENKSGVYKASKGAYGKKILLIDDVYTTGATASECSKMLINQGSLFVDVFTFARSNIFHTPPE